MNTLIIFKPDAVELGIVQIRMMQSQKETETFKCKLSKEFWEQHYAHVKDEMGDRWQGMIDWLSNGTVIVAYIRDSNGYDWKKHIRNAYSWAVDGYQNLIHQSDKGTAEVEYSKILQQIIRE